MLELNNVFNFSINNKINKEFPNIYIILPGSISSMESYKKHIADSQNLTKVLQKISLYENRDFDTIIHKILKTNITETKFILDNKYNIVILKNDDVNNILFHSLIKYGLRNINLIVLSEDMDYLKKIIEGFLIMLYNIKTEHQKTNMNFYFNILKNNSNLSKHNIQKIIYYTKIIFLIKNKENIDLQHPNISTKKMVKKGITTASYYFYKSNTKQATTLIIFGNINITNAILKLASLIKSDYNIIVPISGDLMKNLKITDYITIDLYSSYKNNTIKYSAKSNSNKQQNFLNNTGKAIVEIGMPITLSKLNHSNGSHIYFNIKNEINLIRLFASIL